MTSRVAVSSPTADRSQPPGALPAVIGNGNSVHPNANVQVGAVRRSSLGFLRRSKSGEPLKSSGNRISRRMLKDHAREEELRQQREAAAVPKYAPRLPDLPPPPQLPFGGEASRRAGHFAASGVPIPPLPGSPPGMKGADYVDPYARTESMTHRGRYSYASSAVSTINSPRRVRRRKDPTPYNILVIGARNCGKTSFLNFLRTSLALPASKRPTRAPDDVEETPQSSVVDSNFTSHYLEAEIDHERVGITLWDSQGLEQNLVDLQLREITSFLESKFEDSFNEEMKVVRAPGVRDTHIHCAFLILDPARLDANIAAARKAAESAPGKSSAVRVVGGLDEDLDLQVLRTMQGKTTVVPIISKADTVTTAHMAYLKKTVWDSLKKANLDPLEALSLDDPDDDSMNYSLDRFDEHDEDAAIGEAIAMTAVRRTPDSDTMPVTSVNPAISSPSRNTEAANRKSSSSSSSASASPEYFLPLSILSPDPHSLEAKDEPIGRRFPWGFADPYNPEHCDFLKLKDAVFGEWRGELREASREIWYERWRTSRLNPNGTVATAGNAKNGASRGIPRSSRSGR